MTVEPARPPRLCANPYCANLRDRHSAFHCLECHDLLRRLMDYRQPQHASPPELERAYRDIQAIRRRRPVTTVTVRLSYTELAAEVERQRLERLERRAGRPVVVPTRLTCLPCGGREVRCHGCDRPDCSRCPLAAMALRRGRCPRCGSHLLMDRQDDVA